MRWSKESARDRSIGTRFPFIGASPRRQTGFAILKTRRVFRMRRTPSQPSQVDDKASRIPALRSGDRQLLPDRMLRNSAGDEQRFENLMKVLRSLVQIGGITRRTSAGSAGLSATRPTSMISRRRDCPPDGHRSGHQLARLHRSLTGKKKGRLNRFSRPRVLKSAPPGEQSSTGRAWRGFRFRRSGRRTS